MFVFEDTSVVLFCITSLASMIWWVVRKQSKNEENFSTLFTRIQSLEKSDTELWEGHNNHEAELRAISKVEGKVDTLIMMLSERHKQ